MKKMSDVFELPVKSPAWSVTNVLDADNKSVCEFKGRDQAECAINAINHVDALVEALEALCIAYEEREYNAIGKLALASADAALAAYRGEL